MAQSAAHFRNIMAAANSSMGDMSALNASALPPRGGQLKNIPGFNQAAFGAKM